MLIGVGGSCLVLAIEAAMSATWAKSPGQNSAVANTGVAMLWIFVFVYAVGVDVGMMVFSSEIYPNHMRAKGMAMTIGSTNLINLVYLQVTSIAFSHVGWKYFLVSN